MQVQTNPHVHDIAFSGISRKKEGVFFVQIGAADGQRFDPIHYFVQRYGWNGILCEPLADIFELLKSTYAGCDGLVFENVAITEKEEARSISRIPLKETNTADIPGWAMGASSLVPDKTLFAREGSSPQVNAALRAVAVEETIQCIRLQSLLDKHGIENIDVLQIDTEGYDAEIIRQLDFSKYRPLLINMEWMWLSPAQKEEVSALLQSHGYQLHVCETDLLATGAPIEEFVVPADEPTPESIPRYFPGILGIISETQIFPESGGAAPEPIKLQLFRIREMLHPIRGNVEVWSFLSMVDGTRSYRDIAETTGAPVESLLQMGREFQSVYIVE
jgi:FkbM family methyltransferase